MNKIVERVRKFIEEESKKPTAKYGYGPYKFHLIPVRDYSLKLANELNADKEVVEIAALLHDVGSIIHGRENHHITGAKIAEEKLREFDYPEEKIEVIKDCILNHRGSVNNKKESVEEQIIADADSLSHFDNIGGLFQAAIIYEGLDQGDAQKSVLKKLKRSWNKLTFKESKKIIKSKYDAAMILLN